MITDVHHIGIVVRDPERARALYGEALGLPVLMEAAAGSRRVRYYGVGSSGLEVASPAGGEPAAAEGMRHVCLAAADIAGVWSRLKERGVPLADVEPYERDGVRRGALAPEAMGGIAVEVAQGDLPAIGPGARSFRVLRIDHLVVVTSDIADLRRRFQDYFGIETRRTMERPGTGAQLAFLKPGEVIIELAQPAGGRTGPAAYGGFVFTVEGMDALVAHLRDLGYPVGDPHPAVQPGARIASMRREAALGVPTAFIEYGS